MSACDDLIERESVTEEFDHCDVHLAEMSVRTLNFSV